MTKKKSKNSDMDMNYPEIAKLTEEKNPSGEMTAIAKIMAHVDDQKLVTIPPREKRFRQMDQAMEKIIREVTSKYNLELSMKVNSLGSLIINITNKGPMTDLQARTIVKDAFSLQDKKAIQINDKILRKLNEKRFIESVAKFKYLFMRTDYHNSQLVLEGGKESISTAQKEILEFIAWNTDVLSVVLDVPLVLQNFIRGKESKNLALILESSGKYVSIAFEKPSRHQITLTGNNKCVEKARDLILALQNRLNNSLIIKSFYLPTHQHDTFMKSFSEDFYDKKNVSVVSNQGKDGTYKVDVAGEEFLVEKVIDVLDQVLRENFATSIECPYWICKYLSSSDDFEKALSKTFTKISVSIVPHEETFTVFCHENITTDVVKKIRDIIDDLVRGGYYNCIMLPSGISRILESKNREELFKIEEQTVTSIFIDNNLNKLSITKSNNGELIHVSSLKTAQVLSEISKTSDKNSEVAVQDTDSQKDTSNGSLSSDPSSEAICLIVGVRDQVLKATKIIKDLIAFYESFITVNISVPNHLHRYLIGVKGKTLNEMIKSYGEHCTISFGKEPPNLESCVLKGPSNEIEILTEALKRKVSEFDRIHHMAEVAYDSKIRELLINGKEFLVNALSRFGDVDTLLLPTAENPSTDRITIIGKKEIVEEYTKYLNSHIKSLSESETKLVSFSEKMVPLLTDFGHAILKVITDDVGSFINIKFPKKINKNEKLEIFGSSEKIAAATVILKKLEACTSNYCYELIKVTSGLIPKLKGQIFDIMKNSGLRIYFSSSNKNSADEQILVIGGQSGVANVKTSIKEAITTIQNTVDQVIHIKADYKKDFLKKRNSQDTLVQKISEENGGVRIFLGERQPGVNTISVEIRGNKESVNKAIASINSHISSFDQRVTKSLQFDISTLNSILSKNRQLLKETMNQFSVVLSISENYYQALRQYKIEGKCEMAVRGQPDDVDNTIEYLKGWTVSIEKLPCTCNLQRNLFHPRSPAFYNLTRVVNVDLDLGYMHEPPVDYITITGYKVCVQKALESINLALEDNYELKIDVSQEYFTRLIGKRGQFINNFNVENNVIVKIPPNSSDARDVFIVGKKSDCLLAEKKIYQLIDTWKSTIVKNFDIDNSIKFKLCGVANEHLRSIARTHSVIASLVHTDDRNPPFRTVKVSGTTDNVESFIKAVQEEIAVINEECGQEYLYDSHKNNNNFEIDIGALSVKSNQEVLTQGRRKKNAKKIKNYEKSGFPTSLLNGNQHIETNSIVNASDPVTFHSTTEQTL